LVAALVTGVAMSGLLVVPNPHQLALGLALAILVVQAVLGWRVGIGFSGPASDIACIVLVFPVASILPQALSASCTPQPNASYIQVSLYLLGAGGSIVVACAALTLVLRARFRRFGDGNLVPDRFASTIYLQRGTEFVLILLGAGLVFSAWMASQEVGRLIGGERHQIWMAITWLLAAAGLLAWRLEGQSRRGAQAWAVTLVLLAAPAAVLGLVVLDGLGPAVGL
jgi:hypothetical protein